MGFVISGGSGLAITAIAYDSTDYKLSINLGGLVTNQQYDLTIGIVGYTGTAPTSWTPYSNICPISGHTWVTVYVKSEYDASATPTVEITFPDGETVYSGTLTINEDGSGEIVCDTAYAVLNDKTKWEQVAGTITFRYNNNFDRKFYSDSYTGLLCTAFKADGTLTNYCRWVGADSKLFGVRTMDGSITLETLQSLSENGDFAICYDIEPVTIPLTAEQISTIKGMNVVWVEDSDEISVTYIFGGEDRSRNLEYNYLNLRLFNETFIERH